MRRAARTTLSAFSVGIFWATAAVGAFVGGLHLWAPPAPDDQETLSVAPRTQSRVADRQAVSVEIVSTTETARATPGQRPGLPSRESLQIESQRVLARGIQQELVRVGCYAGAVDGKWSDGTRSAMTAFNEAVGTKLPVIAPDYILLTMLQGHGTRACVATAAPVVAVTKPAARTVGAKDTVKAEPQVVPKNGSSFNTETVLVAPSAPIATSATQPGLPASARAAQPTSQHQMTAATDVAASVPGTSAAPLPGRMTVGAPPSVEPVPSDALTAEKLRKPSEAGVVNGPGATKATTQPRPRDTRQAASVSPESSASRSQRTFTDLNRNAP